MVVVVVAAVVVAVVPAVVAVAAAVVVVAVAEVVAVVVLVGVVAVVVSFPFFHLFFLLRAVAYIWHGEVQLVFYRIVPAGPLHGQPSQPVRLNYWPTISGAIPGVSAALHRALRSSVICMMC